MSNGAELLTREVSCQNNVWACPTSKATVQMVLDDIRSCRYAEKIDRLRLLISQGDRSQYDVEKMSLPGVTFSGAFNGKRRLTELVTYTELLTLDVDDLEEEALATLKCSLAEDDYVLACWASPSQEGMKGLVGLSFVGETESFDTVTRHRAAFIQVAAYFENAHGILLDQSGIDITRLCFLSSDPELHLRTDATLFKVSEIPESFRRETAGSAADSSNGNSTGQIRELNTLLYRTEGKNKAANRKLMGSLIKFLEKRNLSITGSRDCWVRVALAVADTFTYDVGKEYFLRLCRLDGDAHDEDGSIRLLESCYVNHRGETTFGTIFHYARRHGYGKL